jgi:hypothetical protein
MRQRRRLRQRRLGQPGPRPDHKHRCVAAWERVVPGGDCQCSDGSEFSFWVREANRKKVVLYLQDGGACFSAKTCAPGSDLYPLAGIPAKDLLSLIDGNETQIEGAGLNLLSYTAPGDEHTLCSARSGSTPRR